MVEGDDMFNNNIRCIEIKMHGIHKLRILCLITT